jgi:hypothetical protein
MFCVILLALANGGNQRCTKGIGQTQPTQWQDAGETLGHDGLHGCHMPKGPGGDVPKQGGYLQYNEVRHRLTLAHRSADLPTDVCCYIVHRV